MYSDKMEKYFDLFLDSEECDRAEKEIVTRAMDRLQKQFAEQNHAFMSEQVRENVEDAVKEAVFSALRLAFMAAARENLQEF